MLNTAKNQTLTTAMDVVPKQAMAKQDRRFAVLAFLEEVDLILKSADIYRNMKFHRRITFEIQTVRNVLHELVDGDYVRRVNIEKIPDRELVDVGKGNKKSGYVITDKGREVVQSGGFE